VLDVVKANQYANRRKTKGPGACTLGGLKEVVGGLACAVVCCGLSADDPGLIDLCGNCVSAKNSLATAYDDELRRDFDGRRSCRS
jgi:hypothetical protein